MICFLCCVGMLAFNPLELLNSLSFLFKVSDFLICWMFYCILFLCFVAGDPVGFQETEDSYIVVPYLECWESWVDFSFFLLVLPWQHTILFTRYLFLKTSVGSVFSFILSCHGLLTAIVLSGILMVVMLRLTLPQQCLFGLSIDLLHVLLCSFSCSSCVFSQL